MTVRDRAVAEKLLDASGTASPGGCAGSSGCSGERG